MKRVRIIPVLLLQEAGFYKTTRFKEPKYIGDPINTVKIFNEKGADEVVILDIGATRRQAPINFKKISEIAGEAFMPMAYGGGIRSLEDAKAVLDVGYEKVVINTCAFENPTVITAIAQLVGSQSTVVSMDVGRSWWGGQRVFVRSGTKNTGWTPVAFAQEMQRLGAGEIILNSIQRDGSWDGYDLDLIRSVARAVTVPVVACGGAGCMDDFRRAVEHGASAVAAGSMFVYQKKNMGVLISFPEQALVMTG